MSQDTRIASQLGSTIDLLQETLESHRYALKLNQENADILFNTGQVLTSLAEALLEHAKSDEDEGPSKVAAKSLLEEAVQKFSECLTRQELEFSEAQRQIAELQEQDEVIAVDESASAAEAAPSDTMETFSNSSDTPGDWAIVVEPVTAESLLDTAIAQLGSLTALVGLYSFPDVNMLNRISEIATPMINTKIPQYISLIQPPSQDLEPGPTPGPSLTLPSHDPSSQEPKTSAKDDALVASANYRAAVLEALYRINLLDTSTYAAQLTDAFKPLILSASSSGTDLEPAAINAISAYADAVLGFAAAISDAGFQDAVHDTPENNKILWTALSTTQSYLGRLTSPATTASLSPARLADIFIARGDVDLLRFRLAKTPMPLQEWAKSAKTLIANAGVYYRGARTYAERAGATDVQGIANMKAEVAEILRKEANGSAAGMEPMPRVWQDDMDKVLRGMVEEGLLEKAWIERIRMIIVEE